MMTPEQAVREFVRLMIAYSHTGVVVLHRGGFSVWDQYTPQQRAYWEAAWDRLADEVTKRKVGP